MSQYNRPSRGDLATMPADVALVFGFFFVLVAALVGQAIRGVPNIVSLLVALALIAGVAGLAHWTGWVRR